MSDFELFQSMIDASKGNQNKDMTARFYDRSVKTERIDENGLPVFEDVCFVEIRVKDSYDVYDQPATEEKKQRFATEYSRYLVGKKQVENGSPLEQFAFLTAFLQLKHWRSWMSKKPGICTWKKNAAWRLSFWKRREEIPILRHGSRKRRR